MLEDHGLIIRTVYNQIPPRVEYSLSDLGKNFKPVLDELEIWGNQYIEFLKNKNQISDQTNDDTKKNEMTSF
jgi:DNA-binding HxlR family transcriptional regulator